MYLPGLSSPRGCLVALYVWEGSEREQCHLLCSWLTFSHFPCYPKANWALLVLIPGWVVLCAIWDPVGLFKELSCEAASFSCCLNPQRFLQSEVLGLYFPTLESWIVWSVLLPSCSFQFILMQMWDRLVCQPLPCYRSSLPALCVSTPLASLDECFFNSLVVGLPCRSIFWQFWQFFVFVFFFFNLLLSFWLCEEAKCISLCLHLGQNLNFLNIISEFSVCVVGTK